MKKVCISITHSCPRAQVDVAKFYAYFAANGWATTDDFRQADLTIVAACGFDAATENEGIRLIGIAEGRKKPGCTLVVAGCLSGICDERLRRELDVVLLPAVENDKLDEIISATVPYELVADPNVIEPYVERASACFTRLERHADDSGWKALFRTLIVRSGIRQALVSLGWKEELSAILPHENAYSIRIAHGCMGECSYCAIRFADGPLRSRPLASVLADLDRGLSEGFTEIKLIAGDTGAYGQDLGISVVDLLGGIMARPQRFKLSVMDFNIRWLLEYRHALIPLLARSQERIRFLSVPVESGSERILDLMKRGHTAGDARDVLHELRDACPDMFLETQVIVGFPGETEQDLHDTMDLLRAMRFDRVDVYDYSDRPKTVASTMPGKIAPAVIRRRSRRVRREFVGRWASVEYAARDWGRRLHS